MRLIQSATLLLALALVPGQAATQGAEVALGGLRQDTSLPVEITADSLSVDQAGGTAVFTGNVVVIQGEMRLGADEVQVIYATGAGAGAGGAIEELRASGGVTFVTGTDAAEAAEAVYRIDEGSVVMTGDVLLTQGQNALSGERLVIDLEAGTGTMEGRVRTVFRPSNQ